VGPTWTILIATLGQRGELLGRLLAGLLPQVDAAAGRVQVLAYWDSGELTERAGSALDAIALKRQALLDAVTTDYVSFLDDDDWVSDDYIRQMLRALDRRPDMVGFTMMVYRDGKPTLPGKISLRYDGWSTTSGAYLRDITHANPMRTEIAQTATFMDRRGGPEDIAWVEQLRGKLRTQVVIDRVLQHYDYVRDRSTWGAPGRVTATDPAGQPWRPIRVASRHFRWHPDSLLPEGAPVADLLIVVPSRTRPHNVRRLIDAWEETGAFEVASMRIDVDVDDPKFRGYEALVAGFPQGARLAVGHRWRPLVWKLNRAARQESLAYEALGFMGDDHVPMTHGWAQRYLTELRELGTGIVYCRDDYQDERLPTQWAMTSDIVRAIGNRLVPAPVDHLYCDNSVLDLGRAAECIRYLPDVLIQHRHCVNGMAETDEQYLRVNSRAQYAKDKPAYERWVSEALQGQTALVRALRAARAPFASAP
jgi:hypothetical protein